MEERDSKKSERRHPFKLVEDEFDPDAKETMPADKSYEELVAAAAAARAPAPTVIAAGDDYAVDE